jgi:hypothetical protein
MSKFNWLVASLAATLVLACSSQKAPAEQAVAKIDTALSAVQDAATKYAPDTLQTVQGQVASLKQSLAKGDYQGVLAAAPAVTTAIASLKQDVDSKQAAADAALAQTKQQWRTLNAEVPKMVADLHTQVDTLSKGGRLPKGVTKASLQSAKDGVSSLDSMWNDANSAVSSEDYAGAVTKGQAVKDKATELMHTLGMKTT